MLLNLVTSGNKLDELLFNLPDFNLSTDLLCVFIRGIKLLKRNSRKKQNREADTADGDTAFLRKG